MNTPDLNKIVEKWGAMEWMGTQPWKQRIYKALTEATEPLQREVDKHAENVVYLSNRLEQSERACAKMWHKMVRVEEILSFAVANNKAKDFQLAQDQFQMALDTARKALSSTAGTDYIHKSKLEELQKDKERLDWLESTTTVLFKHNEIWAVGNNHGEGGHNSNLRLAIDSAMQSTKKEQ